jgi:hypothetical protein
VISRQWRTLLLWLVLVALVTPACGPVVDADAATEPGGAAGESGAPAGEEDVPLIYTGVDVSGLSSYRSRFVLTFVGTDEAGAPVDLSWTISEARSSDPPASYYAWDGQGSGVPGASGSIELVQIEGAGYMTFTDDGESECIPFPAEGSPPEQTTFSPDTFLAGADLSQAQRFLPDENINGVATRHYSIGQQEVSLSGFSGTLAGDIWVAVDGGHVVRQTISTSGQVVALGGIQGYLEWTYDLLEINGPVSIEPPANCEATPGSDLPMMADAFDVSSDLSALGGVISYSTASPVADVVAFYTAQMPALGWTAGPVDSDTADIATMEFTRGTQKASLAITQSEDVTSVEVIIEEAYGT